jgi:uncharacterized protein (TIGR02118 family)
MIKLMVFLSRPPTVDRQAFKAYYETRHVPLVMRLMPTIDGYERNYPDVAKVRPPEGKTVDEMVDFDAVTMLRFDSREAFETYKQALRDPEIMRVIQADEANFLDNTKTRLFVVEEHEGGGAA